MKTITIQIQDDGKVDVSEDDGMSGSGPEQYHFKSAQDASDAVTSMLTNPNEEQGESAPEPNETPTTGGAPSQSMWDQEATKRSMSKRDQQAY